MRAEDSFHNSQLQFSTNLHGGAVVHTEGADDRQSTICCQLQRQALQDSCSEVRDGEVRDGGIRAAGVQPNPGLCPAEASRLGVICRRGTSAPTLRRYADTHGNQRPTNPTGTLKLTPASFQFICVPGWYAKVFKLAALCVITTFAETTRRIVISFIKGVMMLWDGF